MADDRRCACGCGASIADKSSAAQYTKACQLRIARQRRWSPRHGLRVQHDHESAKRIKSGPQSTCILCAGVPWARTRDRIGETRNGNPRPVSSDGLHCDMCGEEYAQPVIERGSAIVSSAAACASHGELYGTKW